MSKDVAVVDQSKPLPSDLVEFLNSVNFTPAQFAATGLDWEVLKQIRENHVRRKSELESTAAYVFQRLQRLDDVHSIKVRIKDPDHLLEKIIRKKIESADFDVAVDTYRERVTDLIGIRALHLFKDQWRPIHEFVKANWKLHENPIAYVRKGDTMLDAFAEADCHVEEHSVGYRSVHYVIESQPSVDLQLDELQVRTIFEEGWSEIDHNVRYPRRSADPNLSGFLGIFNRLAGSADEMGSFIKVLSQMFNERQAQDRKILQMETELKNTISKLKIKDKEKERLEAQIEEFRKESRQTASSLFLSSSVNRLMASPSLIDSAAVISLGTLTKTCTRCHKEYKEKLGDTYLGMFPERCPSCRYLA